jgi:hypothetical protein
MEDPSRGSTESRSAPATTTAPTVHTDTIDDIVPVLVVAASSDGTLDGHAISGVASMPATCSMAPSGPSSAGCVLAIDSG